MLIKSLTYGYIVPPKSLFLFPLPPFGLVSSLLISLE